MDFKFENQVPQKALRVMQASVDDIMPGADVTPAQAERLQKKFYQAIECAVNACDPYNGRTLGSGQIGRQLEELAAVETDRKLQPYLTGLAQQLYAISNAKQKLSKTNSPENA